MNTEQIIMNIAREDFIPDLKPYMSTDDTGRAQLFATTACDKLRYCLDTDTFWRYTGTLWEAAGDGAGLTATREFAYQVQQWADKLPEGSQERIWAKTWGMAFFKAKTRRMLLDMVRGEEALRVSAADFDRHPFKLNTPQGVIDLHTGQCQPHDPSLLLTQITGVPYDPAGRCPQFEAFVREFCGGDEETYAWLQKLAGYALTGDTSEQMFLIMNGPGGNGKSTYWDILRQVFGTYAAAADPKAFVRYEKSADKVPEQIDALRGKRLVTSSEPPKGSRWDEDLLKALTGDEEVRTRRLFSNGSVWRPACKLVFSANHLPLLSNDMATWRRVRLMQCTADFSNSSKRVLGYAKGVVAAEGPAILRWLVEGCLAWQRERLGNCPAITLATAAYRQDSDVIGLFLKERCDVAQAGTAAASDYKVASSALYDAYKLWCDDNRSMPVGNRRLTQDLQERGFQVRRTKACNTLTGLRLASAHRAAGQDHVNLTLMAPAERVG